MQHTSNVAARVLRDEMDFVVGYQDHFAQAYLRINEYQGRACGKGRDICRPGSRCALSLAAGSSQCINVLRLLYL
jgi:hypothetical protein